MNREEIDEKLTHQALVNLCILLVDSINGQKVSSSNAWKFDAQMLSFKLFRHACSLRKLYEGMRIKVAENTGIEFVDHSSMLVITRAMLETYLVFYFIYGNHEEDLSVYRHHIWRYAGLMDRQKLQSITNENKKKQERELRETRALSESIKSNRYFLETSSPKQQKQLLNGNWKSGKTWNSLAVDAGFHPVYFKNVYTYLCGYSHSSWASALQIRDAKGISEQKELAKLTYFVGIVTMAHFCIAYAGFFPKARAVLNDNEELHKIARFWRFTGEDMTFYDH